MSGKRVNFSSSPPAREVEDIWHNQAALQDAYRTLYDINNQQAKKLEDMERDFQELKSKWHRQTDELEDTKNKLLKRAKSAESQAEQYKTQNEQLKSQSEQHKSQSEQYKSQRDQYKTQRDQYKTELDLLRGDLDRFRRENDKLKEAESEAARLRAALDHLQLKYDNLRSPPSTPPAPGSTSSHDSSSKGSGKPRRSASKKEKERLAERFERDGGKQRNIVAPPSPPDEALASPRNRRMSYVAEPFSSPAARPTVAVQVPLSHGHMPPLTPSRGFDGYSTSQLQSPAMSQASTPSYSSVPRSIRPAVSVSVDSVHGPEFEDGNYHKYPLPDRSKGRSSKH